MNPWDRFFEEKIREIASERHVLDVGGGIKFGKDLHRYAGLFARSQYRTLDREAAYKPDIVGDVHAIPLSAGSVDAVICKAVLEHVEEPGRAVAEISRVLRPGGKALLYVPFLYPYHARAGVYKDFYRFSKDGVEYLFRNFSRLEYVPIRGAIETWLYFLPLGLNRMAWPVGRIFDHVRAGSGNQVSGFNIFVVK